MKTTIRLNVVVPCYNPPQEWEQALAERFAQFRKTVADLTSDVHLVVVNDGSPRNAEPENFNRLKTLIPDVQVVTYTENRGKGHALRQGVAASEADQYLVTDADFPYTLESMRRVVITGMEKSGIAAGNRDTSYYDRVPAFRRLLSKALRWMLRNVLHQPVDDSQCGLKGFDQTGKAVFLETTIDRFLFDLEFLMLANGRVPVTPVTVELREGVVFSKVGLKILATEGRNFLGLLLHTKKTKDIIP
jgi:glycosyltransferase involved in cell wall biosynthesis